MTTIKIVLLFFIVTIGSANTSYSQIIEPKLYLEAVSRGTINVSECDSAIFNLIEIKLTNRTDSVCRFMAYSCCTAESILIYPETFEVCKYECSLNSPIQIEIEPNEDFSIPFIIKNKKRETDLTSSVRFGLVLFPPKLFTVENFNHCLNLMKREKENVIWSNPISLQLYGGTPYVIR